MKKIAITGNIGSGKTTVCKIFESMDVPIFYADDEAKKLYLKENVKRKVKSIFGENVFKSNSVSFNKLASIVFSNPELLKKLENIIYPELIKEFNLWLKENKDASYIIMENAVLFEKNFDVYFDNIITVTCPEKVRIDRILKRDNVKREDVIMRIKNQFSENEKIAKSTFIIVNDGIKPVLPQIDRINREIIENYQKI